jgi:hypothetical protein
MSSVRLTDNTVLHFPGAPFFRNVTAVVVTPANDDLRQLVSKIPDGELLLFARRLVSGARKRRRDPRWSAVNEARLRMARLCIDRALTAVS